MREQRAVGWGTQARDGRAELRLGAEWTGVGRKPGEVWPPAPAQAGC